MSLPVMLAALLALSVSAQTTPPAAVQSNTFNSTFKLSPDQIALGQLTQPQAEDFNTIYQYYESYLANGGTAQDDFYTLDLPSPPTAPGVLLKTQDFTNTSSFALPPNTALSRIIYTSTNVNGSIVPASAFILWPFSPRVFPSQPSSAAPVVLWSHGTSGFFANSAPSTFRNLLYNYESVFPLAQQGYAVVASDYAGLGYNRNFTGHDTVPHQYLANTISARDSLYALQAARKAFSSRLSEGFVSFGHSQGGAVAWAVSEVLAEEPELGPGYRGCIAASPASQALKAVPNLIVPFVSIALGSIFPSFDRSEWLTPLGASRVALFERLRAGLEIGTYLFGLPGDLVQPGWNETWEARAFSALADNGHKPVKGPLLVIHGSADPVVSYATTKQTVDSFCGRFPDGQLSFLTSNGTGHVATLDATHRVWMDWIADRFNGVPVPEQQCGDATTLDSFLPSDRYPPVGNAIQQWVNAPQFSYLSTFLV